MDSGKKKQSPVANFPENDYDKRKSTNVDASAARHVAFEKYLRNERMSFMYTYTWYQWLLFFFIYCFIGWIIESTYVSLKCGHPVNRGFLRLPLLPLYGSGAIIMLWASLPFQDNLFLVFISGMIGASALEYATGYVMERLFKMKYWDYTGQPLNLNGYICLGTSIAWGFLTIVLTEFIHRPVEHMVLGFTPLFCIIADAIVSVLFAADAIESTREALDLGKVLESMTKMKTELEEIQLQMALLKAEASQRVSDIRDEQIQRAANLKGEAAVRLTTLKVESAARKEEALEALKESAERKIGALSSIKENVKRQAETAARVTPDLSALTERFQSITEKREKLSMHLGFYRKGLLRGNPTASSKQFGEALKELREKLKN